MSELSWAVLVDRAFLVAEALDISEDALMRLAEVPRELREAALLILLARIEGRMGEIAWQLGCKKRDGHELR